MTTKYPEQSLKLKQLRDSFDYTTVASMAEALGFSQSTMSGYLSGDVCSVELIFALFDTHKISPNWFLLDIGAQFLNLEESEAEDHGILKSKVLSWDESERKELAIALLQA